jgi:hypothetical protein
MSPYCNAKMHLIRDTVNKFNRLKHVVYLNTVTKTMRGQVEAYVEARTFVWRVL